MVAHQSKCGVCRELFKPPADDRHAEVKARHGQIHQPTDPRPIRGSPTDVIRLTNPRVMQFDRWKMAKQKAMRVKRPLGRAGCAGCVDQNRGIVCTGGTSAAGPTALGSAMRFVIWITPMPRATNTSTMATFTTTIRLLIHALSRMPR